MLGQKQKLQKSFYEVKLEIELALYNGLSIFGPTGSNTADAYTRVPTK